MLPNHVAHGARLADAQPRRLAEARHRRGGGGALARAHQPRGEGGGRGGRCTLVRLGLCYDETCGVGRGRQVPRPEVVAGGRFGPAWRIEPGREGPVRREEDQVAAAAAARGLRV